MGGTSSPFCWALAYDPIIEGTATTNGIQVPTYVDDSGLQTVGPEQTVRAEVFLLAAGHAAGLLAEGSPGTWLEHDCLHDGARAALASLPVTIRQEGSHWTFRGVSPLLVRTVLEHHCSLAWCEGLRAVNVCCHRAIKTALVPRTRLAAWHHAMRFSPFGADHVTPHWPYLGVVVAAPSYGVPVPADEWSPAGLAAVRQGTWQRAITRADARIRTLASAGGSPGLRAWLWNSHILSLVPFPTQVCLPSQTDQKHLRRCWNTLVPAAGWAPSWVLTGLGHAFGIAGSPRCPDSAIRAGGAASWLRHQGWGPRTMAAELQRSWHRLTRWAALANDDPANWRVDYAARARRIIHDLQQSPSQDDTRILLRRAGGALAYAAWHSQYGPRLYRWFQNRSASRRWLATDGAEWDILRACRHYTAAYHVLRLFAAGLHSPEGPRSRATRDACPRLCRCGSPHILHAWLSPDPQRAGQAWCAQCSPPALDRIGGWAATLTDADLARGGLFAQAAQSARAEIGELNLVPTPACMCCPLCGRGEGGSEHLLTWCPAVALAWHDLVPNPCFLRDAVRRRQHTALLSRFLHQVSFLHSALRGHSSMEWRAAGQWLVRAAQTQALRQGLGDAPNDDADYDAWLSDNAEALHLRPPVSGANHDDDEDEGGIQHLPVPSQGISSTWSLAPLAHCTLCPAPPALGLIRASAGPALREHDLRPHQPLENRPVASRAVSVHAPIGYLWGDQPHALWPIAHTHWWPPPRVVPAAAATAAWRIERCPHCGQYTAELVTTIPLGPGAELTVAAAPHVLAGNDLVPWEVTFDGGARLLHGRRVAGAGALLWGAPDAAGRRPILARARVALPAEEHAQVAEAWGLRLGLLLLRRQRPSDRRARVIGDNLAVVRFGASMGRLRGAHMHGLVGPMLSSLHSQGWTLDWRAVRRRLNAAADEVATDAVHMAAGRAAQGLWQPHIVFDRFPASSGGL